MIEIFSHDDLFLLQIITVLDIISVQSSIRRWVATKTASHLRKRSDCAIKIQAAARGYIAYTNYVFTLIDIIFCQAIVRSKIARIRKSKLLNHEAVKQMSSAVLIQAFFRRHIARKRFAKIKAYDACRNCALIRNEKLSAALLLQKSWRRFKVQSLHSSATCIQRKWRLHMKCVNTSRSAIDSIIFIQAVMRRALAEKRTAAALRCVAISESDNIMMFEREACIILQRWWEDQSYILRLKRRWAAAATLIVSPISLHNKNHEDS